MNHNHDNCCQHDQVRYCKVCQVVHCLNCQKEWGRPTYYTYTYPYLGGGGTGYYNTGGAGVSGNLQSVTNCQHGGQ